MTTTTRRGLLSIAGQSLAVAVLSVAPVAAIAAPHAQSEIQRRLIIWAKAVLTYTHDPRSVDDPEWEALHDAASYRRDEVMALPANTAEDMAIKAYLAIHYAMGGTWRNAFGIDYHAGIMAYDAPAERLVADALLLSPLLRSIVERGNG